MKKVIYSIVASGLILACSCQTIPVPIAFTADPNDAKIYVDGTCLGTGAGTSSDQEAGDYPVSIFESMQVDIVHPDYELLSTVLRPKPDWANQLLCTTPLLLLGGLMVIFGSSKIDPQYSTVISPKVAGGGLLLCGSLCFALFWKFDKTYSFKLAKKGPADGDSD